MTRLAASAPGKFVLSGEYAVLDGAPAVCAAVDRRAVVSIETHDGPCHVVSAPGFAAASGRFAAGTDGLTWLADGRDFSLFEAVWNAARPLPAAGSLRVSLDTTAFRETGSGSKLGLGSSAALTAAVATALHALGGAAAAEVAHAAHRNFQGGAGSGVDIACSIAGGIIEYCMEDRRSAPLEWPEGLHYSLLWSGVVADTQARIARFSGQPASRSREDLGMASRAVASLWQAGDAPAIVAGVGAYTQALQRFDEDHKLGIFDAGHAQLAARAAGAGLVYKPCGAGGGDIGVALATSRSSLASFEKSAMRAGFTVLELHIDPRGAMLHDKDEP